MRVYFYDRPVSDPFSDHAGEERQILGTLTTDHAASRYGLPVVVADDGTVYGPADLPAGDRTIIDLHAAGAVELIDAARRAGYVVASATYPA